MMTGASSTSNNELVLQVNLEPDWWDSVVSG